MTSNVDDATPNGLKRSEPPDVSTPASAKKRKLDDDAAESTNAPRTLSSIASAIGNVFGYGSQPQSSNVTTNASAAPSSAPAPKARPAIKLAALKGTIWDSREKPRLGGSPSKATPTKSPSSKNKATPKSSARKSQAATADSPSKPRPRGRPRKYPIAPVVEFAEEDQQGEGESTDELAAADATATPSSVQKQASAKRLWAAADASPAPKGILTPSKNRTQTPKSVKFDKQVDGDLFFEDLPTAKKPATARMPKAKEPDVLCGLCAKGHSRHPNQIILCENCDYAVHQQCYGVEEIPEGDWLCKGCAQDDLETPMELDAATAASARAADVPDIPNIDQHLRSLQRVLLDRCTGRRRIEMFGLQEVHEKARQMVEQTVVAGEGNSMLLIGGRGSGKTTVSRDIDAIEFSG